MTFRVDDRVLFTVPEGTNYVVGRATIKRVLPVTKHRIVVLYHIKCDGGAFKYVEASCLTALLGSEAQEPAIPETYELTAATEAI